MEIYRQTSDSITLSIYVNGELKNADISGITHLVYITITKGGTAIVTNAPGINFGVGKYEYVLTTDNTESLGDYKATWTFTVDGVENTKVDYFSVVVPYTTATEFRDMFPHLDSKTNEEVYRKERLARRIIDSFTNQKFDFEDGVMKVIRCSADSNSLYLPRRLETLTTVTLDGADSLTAELELVDDYWLRPIEGTNYLDIDIKKGIVEPVLFFSAGNDYHVTGFWGWPFVPENIQMAARLLIADYFDDDYMLRQHGVISAQLGDRSINFHNDLSGTTGNFDVDVLLSAYTDIKMGLV